MLSSEPTRGVVCQRHCQLLKTKCVVVAGNILFPCHLRGYDGQRRRTGILDL
jgi:hypothetical protein